MSQSGRGFGSQTFDPVKQKDHLSSSYESLDVSEIAFHSATCRSVWVIFLQIYGTHLVFAAHWRKIIIINVII